MATRAERFHLLTGILRGVPYLDVEEAARATPLTPLGRTSLTEATDEDLALAGAALCVEAELRENAYAALEWLGALVAGSDGTLEERVTALPDAALVEAARPTRARMDRRRGRRRLTFGLWLYRSLRDDLFDRAGQRSGLHPLEGMRPGGPLGRGLNAVLVQRVEARHLDLLAGGRDRHRHVRNYLGHDEVRA